MEPRGTRARALLAALLLLGLVVVPAAPARATLVTDDAALDATGLNSQRKVARDSAGRLYVALQVPDVDLGMAIRVFRSDDNSATFSLLPPVPDAASEMSRASVAVDGRDEVHLTWTELVGTNLQVFHSGWTGALWRPRTQVSATPGYSGFPAIAVDRGNVLHAAWYGFDGETYQVYYRARAANGTWGRTETVSTGLQDANNPALAIGPDDRPHVAWFLVSGGRWSVVYMAREARWASVTALSDPSARALDPSLAVASDGRVFAAWTEEHVNGTRAVVARYADAGEFAPPAALAWFSLPGGHPAVALDGQDRAFVFWDELDASIRYRTFNGSWGPTVALAANGTASFPSPRWAAVANPFFSGVNRMDIAWTEATGGTHSVVLAGITVPAVGAPPTTSPDLAPALLLGTVLVLAGVVWILRRRSRRLRPMP